MNASPAQPRQEKTKDGADADPPAGWKEVVRRYQRPSRHRAVRQIANTLIPYALLWVLMYFSLSISYGLVVPQALLAGAFLIRIFVIFHDCTHGSFFKSKRANELLGFVTGLLVFTPFHQWRWEHALHHSSAGDLDRRGMGDVWTLTVDEYLASSRWKRFCYRVNRNPLVLFTVAPLFHFLVIHRIPSKDADPRTKRMVHATTLAILLLGAALAFVFGLKAYLVIQLTAIAVASITGVWLFYVQHQYEDVYWERRPDWDFAKAALEGSSFYKLPKILQWFSGNIGFHHIHHLSPRIPNYELERAHESEAMFREIEPLTMRKSLKSLGFRLWDEDQRKLTGYEVLKEARRAKAAESS